MPEGEEEEQEIENLFEKVMKENFSNLAKEGQQRNRLLGSPGSPESPKEVGPKEAHTKIHHNDITQDEREGENLKSSKRKGHSSYHRVPTRLSANFSNETLQARRSWKEVFQVMKGKDLHPRLLYPAKQIKCFSDKAKFKEFIITQPLLYEMLKGLI